MGSKLIEYLDRVQKRPEMYLAKKSVIRLYFYLDGWIAGDPLLTDGRAFYDFGDWLKEKYGDSHNHPCWGDALLANAKDDAEAFENFFVEFNEFLSVNDN